MEDQMDSPQTIQAFIQGLHNAGDCPCLLAVQRNGIEAWSYAEVASTVRQLANGLLRTGVEPGEYVLLLAKNQPEWVLACLAVIDAGATVVPLDTQIGPHTLEHVLRDSGARFIFTTSDHLGDLDNLQHDTAVQPFLLDAEQGDERGWHALLSDEDVSLPTVEPDSIAALFYTSGTTGVPKGVPLTHYNLAFQLQSVLETRLVRSTDRILMPLPMYHIYSFTIGVLVPLTFRVPIVLPQSIAGQHILRAIREAEATLLIGVPRLYRSMLERIESQARSRGAVARLLYERVLPISCWLRQRLNVRIGRLVFRAIHQQIGPSLRLLTSGGSALDPDMGWKLEGLGWQMAIGYGLTETSPLLTLNLPNDQVPRIASVGTPVPGIDLCIDTNVHAEDAASATSNGTAPREGEILVRGPSVFSGYRNLPDQNARVFTDDGWFRTGDMGYQDSDGFVYISGRASTLIVTEGGKNIQPEPVEEHYQQHPFISEIGILQHQRRLVGLIVPDTDEIERQGNDIEQAVREAVQTQSQQIASYQRIGKFAISLEPLPRTNLGKIRRHVLGERYQQAQQDSALAGAARQHK
jgi:long-chain acyl-CoA synthetase